jgi:phosphoribosylformimino-5-aminoimidazole carboxamide ribotide isomerase
MQIYPAIDLRGGTVVRLREGDPNQQITFSDDPVAVARRWQAAGADWVHVVNLDGAFEDQADTFLNLQALEGIAKLGIKVQFGGGLRSIAGIEFALDAGASRVVLGTIAVKSPELVALAVSNYGTEAICVALDARDGKVTTHGWMEQSELTPTQLGLMMAERGVRHALFTDVSRDGMLTGSNVEATVQLGQSTPLQVIASGGVSSLEEITILAQSGAVAGAVIGMALYQGKFTLEAALQAAKLDKDV